MSVVPRLADWQRESIASTMESARDYLGPAVVLGVDGKTAVTIARPDGTPVRAEMALALPYEAREGDVLLVIGQQQRFYVIGVLCGTGKTELSLQGNVVLRAVGGVAEVAGDEGVRLRGPSVEVQTGRLTLLADTLLETVSTLVQRVADSITVHARSSHTVVEEGAYTRAKTAAIRTEETMSINGKQVLLG